MNIRATLLALVLAPLAVSLALAVPHEGAPPPVAKHDEAAPAAKEAAPSKIISSELSGQDLEFLISAEQAGRLQNWLGEQAEKAESDQIKAVGGALKSSQADEDKLLTQIATRKGVPYPADRPPLPQIKKLTEQFEKLKGPKFDKAVMDQILAVNQLEVSLYESAIHSSDSEIKKLAEEVLPLAKEKLQLAEKMTGTARRTNVTPAFRTANPPSQKEKE